MDHLVRDHLMLALVTHVATRYGGMRKPGRSLRGALARWQLQRATEMMASSQAQRVSLVHVARYCDVSPSHFSRAFKASTGLNPSGWLLRLRIDRARDLLRESAASLAEVAARCGFADQAHFTRTFSRYMGVSPGAWRRAHLRA